nr:hypothetical protein [Tanacetum cinerariifolium]
MEEYMTETRDDYGSRIARPKFNKDAKFELKGQLLKELRDNTLSGTNDEFDDSITTWVDLTEKFFDKYYLPSHIDRKKEVNGIDTDVEHDPTNIDFAEWLASKFSNYRTMDRGDLLRMTRIGNMIYFEDYEWYEKLEDGENNDDEVQKNKECFDEHESMEDTDDDIEDLGNYLNPSEHPYYVNKEEQRFKERRYNLLGIPYRKPPTCRFEKFEVLTVPTIPISAEEHLGDLINIRMDIIHLEPDAAVAFLTAAVVKTQAQHGEAIRGIQEQLLGMPIQKDLTALRFRLDIAEAGNASLRTRIKTTEELTSLRFRVDIAEAENASLRAKIKTIKVIEKITRKRERHARVEIEQQLAAVQESQRQDRENFRKVKELVTSQFGQHS